MQTVKLILLLGRSTHPDCNKRRPLPPDGQCGVFLEQSSTRTPKLYGVSEWKKDVPGGQRRMLMSRAAVMMNRSKRLRTSVVMF